MLKAKENYANSEIDFVPLLNIMARQIKIKKGGRCENERIRNATID